MYEGNTKRPMETILFLSLFLFLVLKMSNTKAAQLVTQLGGKEKILAECHIIPSRPPKVKPPRHGIPHVQRCRWGTALTLESTMEW